MKPNPIFAAVAILVFAVAVAGALFLSRQSVPLISEGPSPSIESPQSPEPTKPQFPEGTFSDAENQESIEVSLEGVRDRRSIMVSWDASQVRIFHIVLLNTDFQALWLLSALDGGDVTDTSKREPSLFVPSGYVLGDRIERFEYLEEPAELELTFGQEYYLQMSGLTPEGQEIGINKKFVFE